MTDGPKINVSANLADVFTQMDKLAAKGNEVNKSLSGGQVGIDVKQAKADLASLNTMAKELAGSLKAASQSGGGIAEADLKKISAVLSETSKSTDALKQVLTAIGQAGDMGDAVRDAKAISDHMQRAARAHSAMAKEGLKLSREQTETLKKNFDEWRKSGARGTHKIKDTEFDDWISGGWRKYALNETEARNHRQTVLRSIGFDQGDDGAGPSGKRRSWIGGFGRRGGMAGVVGGVAGLAGSILSGGSGMFSAAGSAVGGLLGVGTGMMFGGPAGAVVGGLAGGLLGGIGQALDTALQRVIAQNSDLTDLRHSIGATKVNFDELRGQLLYFTNGVGLAGDEAIKLGRSFTASVGRDMSEAEIAKGTAVGASVGRSYGMDPASSVQFFGAMRHMGISRNVTDDRKLALMIGEAVAVRGITPRMGDMMKVLETFVETSTRNNLTQANTSGYTSFLSSLMGTGFAGIRDPQVAASMMSSADAALRQGGAFGTASKSFSLGIYQRAMPGFNVFDMKYLNDQGAFGSVSRAFGEDSPAYQLAKLRGDTDTMNRYSRFAKAGGDKSVLAMQLAGLEKQYGNLSSSAFALNGANHLGLNVDQFSALYKAYKSGDGLGNLEKMLRDSGQDMSKVNPQQIAALAEVSTMDRKGLKSEAGRLIGLDSVSEKQKESLQKALASDNIDEIRKVVTAVTASTRTTKDLGDSMREQEAQMKRLVDTTISEIAPYIKDMKDGVIALLRKFVPESSVSKRLGRVQDEEEARMQAASYDERLAGLEEEIKGAIPDVNRYNREAEILTGRRKQLQEELAKAEASGERGRIESIRSELAEVQRRIKEHNAIIEAKHDKVKEYNDILTKRAALPYVDGSPRTILDEHGRSTGKLPDVQVQNGSGPQPFASSAVRTATRDKVLAEARRQGLTPEETMYVMGLAEYESAGFNPNARGARITDPNSSHYGDRAVGVFQYMAKSSKHFNRFNLDENIQHGVAEFKERARQHGIDWAIARHLGGANKDGTVSYEKSDGYVTTGEYIRRIRGRGAKYKGVSATGKARDFTTAPRVPESILRVPPAPTTKAPMKPGFSPIKYDPRIWGKTKKISDAGSASQGVSPAQRQMFEHRITLLDRDGNEVGDSVVQTRVGEPVPQGVGFA